jgi:hypothetical protein
MFTNKDAKQDLEYIQARIAAVAEGIQNNPDNAIDYAQALEVNVILLSQVIHNLYLAHRQNEQGESNHYPYN